MVIFESIKGHELSWGKDSVRGVKKVKVFGTSRTNYIVMNYDDDMVEISEECFNDFVENGFDEI